MGWNSAEDFYGGGYTLEGTSNFEITFGRGRCVRIVPNTTGLSASLPDATHLPDYVKGGPVFMITNAHATNNFTLKDGAGNTLIATVAPDDAINIYLQDNSTAAGTWRWRVDTAGSLPAPPVDEFYYFLAGNNSTGTEADETEEYNVSLDTWTTETAAPDYAWFCAGYVISDKGYIQRGNITTDRQNFEYDAGFDSWSTETAMTEGGDGLCGAQSGGKGYVCAIGESGIPDGVYEWDPSGAGTWSSKTDSSGRADYCGTVRYGATNDIWKFATNVNGSRDEVEEYDVSGDSWSDRNDMVFPGRYLFAHGPNADTDRIYLCCGFGDIEYSQKLVDLDQHNPATDSWINKSDFTDDARLECNWGVAAERIFMAGGDQATTYEEHWEYSPLVDTWTQKTDLPREKYDCLQHGMGINRT